MDEPNSEQASRETPDQQPRRPAPRWVDPFSWNRRTGWIVSLVVLFVLVSGVTIGIRHWPDTQDDTQTDRSNKRKLKKKKKAKPKPAVEISRLETLPSQSKWVESRQSNFRYRVKTGSVKPGHWVGGMQRMRANRRDQSASLGTMVFDGRLPRSAFRIESMRPVSLPKGQNKFVESIFLVPDDGESRPWETDSLSSRQARVVSRLRHRLAGSEMFSRSEFFQQMAASEYFFYVLARRPGDYQFLASLPSTKVRLQEGDEWESKEVYYRMVLPPVMGERIAPVTLPTNPLAWTSITLILWDDVEPESLSPQQQRAMIDWLHWGGQLIVSGPNSLELLKGSFLESYLPAAATGSREITAAALAEVNLAFAKAGEVFTSSPGVAWEPHRQAIAVDQTGELLCQRRVGRGRIVVSAFRLAARQTQRSGPDTGYDRFFAACILGHDKRADDAGERPAAEISKLRYFSRDAGDWTAPREEPGDLESDTTGEDESDGMTAVAYPYEDPRFPSRKAGPGVAGWSDFSPVSQAARQSLREAAGIKVPGADFVVRVLAIYLLVLVPANYLLFRVIGRVEWAWAAAPVIAIVCAAVVINQAQLDIGFARARTEFTVVEMQGRFSRAHVTRYTALYTSLSTRYEVIFADSQALVTPFSKGDQFQQAFGEEPVTVAYRREGGQIRLSGFQIASNSTDWLHSEQMVELGGTIDLQQNPSGRPKVANHTEMSLENAALIKCVESDLFQVAWIGDLAASTSAEIEFHTAGAEHLVERQWAAAANVAGETTSKHLNLQRFVAIAQRRADFCAGDLRLIGWTSRAIGGMAVEPADSQSSYATLVITHLRHGQ